MKFLDLEQQKEKKKDLKSVFLFSKHVLHQNIEITRTILRVGSTRICEDSTGSTRMRVQNQYINMMDILFS
jgi:hypothetical protein